VIGILELFWESVVLLMLGFYSGGRLALAIYRCRKPTIVALQGSAVGLGMTMTLPAAIRYSKTPPIVIL
jgi:enoyl-CoA hydratase/carnithine racemase